MTGYLFFFKQKNAYEMSISDWSSDVCSSDLEHRAHLLHPSLLLFSIHNPSLHNLPEDHRLIMTVRFQYKLTPYVILNIIQQDLLLHELKEIGRASCRERVVQ